MSQPSQKLNLTFDLRVVVGILLLAIIVMTLIWKPWSGTASTRTVEVSGESTVTATPDEFVFYPTYQVTKSDKDAALKEMTDKSNAVTAGLKDLGVADSKIKTNLNAYETTTLMYDTGSGKDQVYNLQLTITVANKDLAQKVQDYLNTTTPTGSITPQASFSDKTRRSLEAKARDEATKDARKKADQMAENLSFKVGKVKEIRDGSGLDAIPYSTRDMSISSEPAQAAGSEASLAVQPGENELNYTITVVYFIK
jgi:uncharacterized protein YggE